MNRTAWNGEIFLERYLARTDFYWKRGRWRDEGFHPIWKDKKPPLVVINKRPQAKRRPGHPVRAFRDHFRYMELKRRVDFLMRAGTSRRSAVGTAMVEMRWKPDTLAEIERVHREIRRMD
jgi:hypothetical protein